MQAGARARGGGNDGTNCTGGTTAGPVVAGGPDIAGVAGIAGVDVIGGAGWAAACAAGCAGGGAPACLRDERRDVVCTGAVGGGFGFAAAAAATPGNTGPVGSAFMILTAGIDAAEGKSILTDTFGFAGAASATGATERD